MAFHLRLLLYHYHRVLLSVRFLGYFDRLIVRLPSSISQYVV